MKTPIEVKQDYSPVTRIVSLASDGKAIAKDIERRVALANKSMNELCAESQVSTATIWRIEKSSVANLRTLAKIDRVLKKWERVAARH